jgi:hypothetical protein
MEKKYTIELNKYQRDNLLWLLLIAWENPELGLWSGDWTYEVAHKLMDDPDQHPQLSRVNDSPNCSNEEWRKNFDQRFIKR